MDGWMDGWMKPRGGSLESKHVSVYIPLSLRPWEPETTEQRSRETKTQVSNCPPPPPPPPPPTHTPFPLSYHCPHHSPSVHTLLSPSPFSPSPPHPLPSPSSSPPSVLEYLSYNLNFHTLLAGPSVTFKEHQAFMDGSNVKLLDNPNQYAKVGGV